MSTYYTTLQCKQFHLDLTGAQRFLVWRHADPVTFRVEQSVFWLLPDGIWLEERSINGVLNYAERHPVMVARRYVEYDRPIPLELCEHREHAIGSNWFKWWKAYANEWSRVATGKAKAAARRMTSPGLIRASRNKKDVLADAYLSRNELATSDEVARHIERQGIECNGSTVRDLPAWRAHQRALENRSELQAVKTRYTRKLTEEQRREFERMGEDAQRSTLGQKFIDEKVRETKWIPPAFRTGFDSGSTGK